MAFLGRKLLIPLRDALVYALAKAILVLFSLLPPRIGFYAARQCGSLLYFLGRRRRNIALRNLDIAFGEKLPVEEKRRVARRTFQHALAIFLGLSLRGRHLRKDNLHQVFHILPEEDDLLSKPHPKGLAVLSAHVGDWEMAEHYFALRSIRATVVTSEISNPLISSELKRRRSRNGMRVIHKEGALREIRSRLRQGGVVGLLPDQNSPKRERFFEFFGVPASTYTDYARVLVRAGCRILLVVCIREGFQLRYRVVVRDLGIELPELPGVPSADRAGLRADELVRGYLKAVEDLARQEPEQYWWGHRRWKSRPTGAPWLYHDLGKPLGPKAMERESLFQ